MKKRLQKLLKVITRSKFDDQVDALHAESRAEIKKRVAEGKGWEGLEENAALLGLSRKSGKRPKMIFGREK